MHSAVIVLRLPVGGERFWEMYASSCGVVVEEEEEGRAWEGVLTYLHVSGRGTIYMFQVTLTSLHLVCIPNVDIK